MPDRPFLGRLSVRLTGAFLLASVAGVALVAALAYRSTASDFRSFVGHMGATSGMGSMMDDMMGAPLTQAAAGFMDNLERTLWMAGLLGIVLAIVLGGLFARYIVSPLGAVAAAAGEVARGDFSRRVEVQGSNELAALGESFNLMAATLDRDRQLRQNMVADIAHELRTPLSILQANVEAMQDGVLESNAENLASLHQETLLLARLVEDLRTLSLADAGQLTLHRQPVDLSALASQVVASLGPKFAAKGIGLEMAAPPALPSLEVDPDRIEQVLRNLVSNALQYTPSGGRVSVGLSADGAGMTLSVADTGIGIPAEHLPFVFDRFYRVDRSRSRSTGASGLGLAIVRQLVTAHEGRAWATSQPGQGSTFNVFLPFPRVG